MSWSGHPAALTRETISTGTRGGWVRSITAKKEALEALTVGMTPPRPPTGPRQV
jgi:hypothetical protein